MDALAVDEPDCAAAAEVDSLPTEDEDRPLSPEDNAALAELDIKSTLINILGGGLGPPGGGRGGAQDPVSRAAALGRRNGLTVTSRKRSNGSSGSDHHVSQRRSDAVDLSNGNNPTTEMDRTARQIASLIGVSNWQWGVLNRTVNGYRVQLIYRTNVGGNHFNHVHVGVRMI